jgi:hypothetical protein
VAEVIWRRWPRVRPGGRARPLTARRGDRTGARRRGARIRAAVSDRTPISQALTGAAEVASRDTVIVDESATSLPHVLRHCRWPRRTPSGSKTGTLGWAMGAALECSRLAGPAGGGYDRRRLRHTVPRRCGRPHGTGCRSPTSSPTTPPTRSSSRGC